MRKAWVIGLHKKWNTLIECSIFFSDRLSKAILYRELGQFLFGLTGHGSYPC